MLELFDGRVLCREAKIELENFLAVTRKRPMEDDELESEDNAKLESSKYNIRVIRRFAAVRARFI